MGSVTRNSRGFSDIPWSLPTAPFPDGKHSSSTQGIFAALWNDIATFYVFQQHLKFFNLIF